MGVREVRVRDVLARRRAQPHPAAREVPPPPLGGGRDGHAAPRGAPAPPVPCHVAAGEVGGSVSVPGLAAQVGVSESTATLVPGRLRGAMARPGCLRRAVGRGRGGRLPRRRARQDEGARAGAVHGHAADARGTRPMLAAAGRTSGRRDASLPAARHVISNLESWAAGTSRGLSTAGPRSYSGDLSWRRSHRGRDATTALVADCCLGHYRRDQLRGETFRPQPPAPPGRGRPGGGGSTDKLRL